MRLFVSHFNFRSLNVLPNSRVRFIWVVHDGLSLDSFQGILNVRWEELTSDLTHGKMKPKLVNEIEDDFPVRLATP